MNQSRIKKIKRAARIAIFATPGLTQQQAIEIYNGTIQQMKGARKRRNLLAQIPKGSTGLYPKQHKNESLSDFKERRKACNARRRVREEQIGL